MDIINLLEESVDIVSNTSRIPEMLREPTLTGDRLKFYCFARLNREISLMLLHKMSSSFSDVEREFVSKLGPEMYSSFVQHARFSEYGGCSEGKEARREGERIRKIVDVKFETANIDLKRKALLDGLVKSAYTSMECPPSGIFDVESFLKKIYESEELAQRIELGQDLYIPERMNTFLSHMLECAKLITNPYL